MSAGPRLWLAHRETRGNAGVNDIVATIFFATDGRAIGLATFVEGASKAVAWSGAEFLGAGAVIPILAVLRGRSTIPAVTS